jgi:hypothetical protein
MSCGCLQDKGLLVLVRQWLVHLDMDDFIPVHGHLEEVVDASYDLSGVSQPSEFTKVSLQLFLDSCLHGGKHLMFFVAERRRFAETANHHGSRHGKR